MYMIYSISSNNSYNMTYIYNVLAIIVSPQLIQLHITMYTYLAAVEYGSSNCNLLIIWFHVSN